MGCGRYDWLFSKLAPHLATHLTITIDAMKVLPPAELSHVLSWVRGLDYPWSTAEQVARLAPRNEPLTPVPRHLATYDSGV